MKYILTPEQMRKADHTAIDEYGIPGMILMENAARSASDYIKAVFEAKELVNPSVIILCGSGNNGGDGFALARHLHESCKVKVFWIGSTEKMSPETLINFNALSKLDIFVEDIDLEEHLSDIDLIADCFIDALIGVGGLENLHGLALSILKKIKDIDCLKVAIDVPTGLNSETGDAHEDCFRADMTVTMFAEKTGLLLNDGPDYSGVVEIADLGAPASIIEKLSNIFVLENEDIINIIPSRKRKSSKFDYGRVLIIAGSRNYPGAAALAANAAITAGAGLVFLFTSQIHPSLMPEIIPRILPVTEKGNISYKAFEQILDEAQKADSIVIGPGLGDEPETFELVKNLINNISKDIPLIIDADGLKAIDKNTILHKNILLTPHTGEFSHLTAIPREQVEKNSLELACKIADKLNCNILLKNVPSIITDGNRTYLNTNGNPGMATGGSGDVLSGIIASFAAQGVPLLEAAAAGAFVHAQTGDRYVEDYSPLSLTASKLIDYLKEVLP
jgi:ADP-dependent NAD(P)H-hydrate dehydratase / NAD(P)H-hydrate epimerase